MVNAIACFKYSIDVLEMKVDTTREIPILKGAPRKISEFDKNAVEEAIQQVEKYGGQAIGVSVGAEDSKIALKEVLAMGLSEVFLIADEDAENSDSITTAKILAKAVEKTGDFDLIIMGEATIDGFTAQVPPALAEFLNIPHIGYVRSLEIDGNIVKAEVSYENETRVIEAEMPVVVTVGRATNEPRIPKVMQIMKAAKKPTTIWNISDIGLTPNEVGETGSSLKVTNIVAPKMERKHIMAEGETAEEKAADLVQHLKKEGLEVS